MSLFDFLLSILAGVIAYYICKWIDAQLGVSDPESTDQGSSAFPGLCASVSKFMSLSLKTIVSISHTPGKCKVYFTACPGFLASSRSTV